MTIAEWIAEATPDRREVPVCFDRRLLFQLDAAVKRRDHAAASEVKGGKTLSISEEEKALQAEVDDLEAKVSAKMRILVFEGLGWGPWRELLSQHPPSDDQAEVFSRAVQLGYTPHALINIGYNAETFHPAAIAASCTDPGITEEQARGFYEEVPGKGGLPPGVLDRIWTAVLEVNTGGGKDPFVVSTNGASEPALAIGKK